MELEALAFNPTLSITGSVTLSKSLKVIWLFSVAYDNYKESLTHLISCSSKHLLGQYHSAFTILAHRNALDNFTFC